MRTTRSLTVLFSMALVACSGSSMGQGTRSESAASDPIGVAQWSGELPISSPWLREQLPTGTLVYQRIPHPLAMMAMPKGNAFDAALGSDANIRSLIEIQRGLVENLGVELPPLRLLEHLRAPIEVAAIATPAVLIGTTLSFRSDEAFEAFVTELGQFAPLALAAPLDDEGFGQLTGLPVPILVRFDAETGNLAVYWSLAADQVTFAALLQAPDDSAAHPMHALERQIDESGQGLFAWVDAARGVQVAAMFNPELAATLAETGASQLQSLAAGAGVANGKGRLKILADLGTGNPNRPIPVVSNTISATSVGEPTSLFLLSVPSATEFRRLESIVLASLPPDAAEGWNGARNAFTDATGTTLEEMLSAIGPELLLVSDQAGGFVGLRVRDTQSLDNVLDQWSEQGGVAIDERTISGQTIRYVDLPGTIALPDEALQGGGAALINLFGRMRNRLYWVADGDYLYLSSTPQQLIDRIEMGADTSVSTWLNDTQRVDFSSSLLGATGSAGKFPRMMYNSYIGLMQSLADLVGVEYDVFAMPTANQLGLPERGAFGATVNLGEPYVSLELSYESHPAELLFGGGGMAAMAAAGIAAAIALPAFQNHTTRAQVAQGTPADSAARQ